LNVLDNYFLFEQSGTNIYLLKLKPVLKKRK